MAHPSAFNQGQRSSGLEYVVVPEADRRSYKDSAREEGVTLIVSCAAHLASSLSRLVACTPGFVRDIP